MSSLVTALLGRLRVSRGSLHTYSSAREFEVVNVAGGNQAVSINGGTAMGVHCSVDGSTLAFHSSVQNNNSLTLHAGFNPVEVTTVLQAGTSLVGTVTLVAW